MTTRQAVLASVVDPSHVSLSEFLVGASGTLADIAQTKAQRRKRRLTRQSSLYVGKKPPGNEGI